MNGTRLKNLKAKILKKKLKQKVPTLVSLLWEQACRQKILDFPAYLPYIGTTKTINKSASYGNISTP